MRPLSVVQVISSPWWTGAAEPALQLAVDLDERGHRVRFVCVPGEALEEKAKEEKIPMPEGLDPTRSLNPARVWRFVKGLADLFRRVEADVVHCHLSADHWLSLLAARLARRPVRLIRSVHHPRAAGSNLAYRYLLGRATDAVIAVSHFIADELLNSSGVSPDVLRVVPGGVDTRRFRPATIERRARGREILAIPPNTLLIGIVSRLAADRGFYPLFAAFKAVAEKTPNVQLAVVGKGEFLPRLQERVQALGIADRVDFHGYHEDDLVDVFAAFDIFTLMTPGSEGSCRAVLEAMAMGLPCVVTDRNGLDEVVKDGETARVVPYGEEGMLASAFVNLLSDKVRRISYGREGRERAVKLYARELRAERVERVYMEALDLAPEISAVGEPR